MPRPTCRTGTRQVMATPNKPSPSKLALNDDRTEKAVRLQSRQALQEMNMNEIRAAASPMRKLNRNDRRPRESLDSSPDTPRTGARDDRRKQSSKQTTQHDSQRRQSRRGPHDLLATNEGNLTPMKRVPILANFEEWMKLATDNKINATNSWNFALIDYFHDMSLLKDGPGGQVNFQKASCTLDGCVKIYTSRVDSVATETGRLLSGLADSGNEEKKKRKGGEDGDEEGEEGEEDEDDEDGGKKKQKKKANRSHEATLAPSFASLQLKKLELEFAVDPLFKKASADFDEGGAKGLLLNHLSIDARGRIVFDSSDDADDATGQQQEQDQRHEEQDRVNTEQEIDNQDGVDQEIDLDSLASKFFPDLGALDEKDICPSMKTFTLGSADLTIPIVNGPEDRKDVNKPKEDRRTPPPDLNLADQTGIFLDGSNGFGFDDDDDGALGGFDMPDDVGFGEGGEAWAKEGALEPMMQVVAAGDEHQVDGDNADGYTVSLQHRYREDAEQQSIMAYFDKAFNSRAKGKAAFNMSLENWRIQKIQKARQSEAAATTTTSMSRPRKEKEPFEIDFNGPVSDNLTELLQAPPVSNSVISLPRTQLKVKGRNLLDKDDEIVDVRAMMRLWTKPKCRIGRRKGAMQIIDEGFGSRSRVVNTSTNINTDVHGNLIHDGRPSTADEDDEEIRGQKGGDYDANFFADDDPLPFMFDGPLPIDDDSDVGDDGADGPGFVDAREMLSPGGLDSNQVAQPSLLNLDDASHDGQNGQEGEESTDPRNLLFPSSQAMASQMLPGSFGSQLVTQQGRRLRPEYVNYARTAKKVDVRALKENMWKGMSDRLIKSITFDAVGRPPTPALTNDDGDVDMMDVDEDGSPGSEQQQQQQPQTPPPSDQELDGEAGKGTTLKFTNMISELKNVYPETQMKDISTSYCFICLLHLANEKGLVLEGGREDGSMNEILVRRDEGVEDGYVGE